jgi:hypothetical protein
MKRIIKKITTPPIKVANESKYHLKINYNFKTISLDPFSTKHVDRPEVLGHMAIYPQDDACGGAAVSFYPDVDSITIQEEDFICGLCCFLCCCCDKDCFQSVLLVNADKKNRLKYVRG